jgi:hypothetical protein
VVRPPKRARRRRGRPGVCRRAHPNYPHLTNEDATRIGRQPTYRVADLNNPIVKPWAVEQTRKANEEVIAGEIPFTADSRCYPAGVPSFLLFPAIPICFIQTPSEVLMIRQHGQIRRIYLNQPHSARPKPSWYGESVGKAFISSGTSCSTSISGEMPLAWIERPEGVK